VPTFLGAHEIPDEFRQNPVEFVRILLELMPKVAELAPFCDVFCEPNVISDVLARQILAAAKNCGMALRVHADQFTPDYGSKVAAELGAATADHLEATTEDGLRTLHAAGVQPVLLPASVYALGLKHYPAARTMIDLGMPVVLATDFNPGSSPTTSMPMVLSLASTHMKMTPAEAITAATINAAYSLRRGDEIGSLEPGKLADFAIHDCADYREIAYFFGRETAWKVWIGGVGLRIRD
jgi:imidazolonepropionase